MRRTRLLALLAAPLAVPLSLSLVGLPGAAPVAAPDPLVPGVTAAALDAAFSPTEPGDVMLAQRGGVIAPGAWARATAQAAALREGTRESDPDLADAEWQLEGPTNIGGRLLDVVVDPTRPDSVFAAAASGGVWHSTDAGMRWTSVWPDEWTQAIGALAVSPSGVLWAGTGEAGPGGGSITYGGDGVYRSDDGGKSWKNTGLPLSERIGRIVVDPTDEQTVWVAAGGPLYSGGGERGVYRTTDAGKTWELVLAGANPTTGAADVALDPVDPSTVYATMWDRLREPDRRTYTGVGSGAFKSTDAGRTWTRIGGPALAASPALGRLGIAVAPSDRNRVYVLVGPEGTLPGGLLRSDDAGATFLPLRTLPVASANTAVSALFPWWFGRVYVDPDSPDTVYSTGVNLTRSTDGGNSFRSVPGVHADQHGMAWDPEVPGRVYLGNDGGAYRSDDDGATFTHGEHMPWNQLFSLDVAEQDPSRMIVGLQDNGANRNYTAERAPAEDGFNDISGGDGTETAIDPRDQEIVYACSQYGVCSVSRNGGTNRSSFEREIVGTRKNWLTPIEFDPDAPGHLCTASEIVSCSENDAADWRPISPDLTGGPGRETNPLFRAYGTITTLAVAKAEHQTVYAGTDDGRVQYTHDGGATWTRATGLPTDWVTSVVIDRADPRNVAYAAFSGFRAGKDKALVFRTGDGGRTWTDVSGDLPQAPVNDVLVLGGDLVVATDVGVFTSRDGGQRWKAVGTGLPNAPITELRWHEGTKTLHAANFGRGAYGVVLPGLSATVPPAPAALSAGLL